jgi:hypothetical protein
MKRRALLQLLAAAAAWLPVSAFRLRAQTVPLSTEHVAQLHALAEAVLPQTLGMDGRRTVVADFQRGLIGYRAGAEMDAGYGFPRLRRTPPSPFGRYPSQLDALDARARASGRGFGDLPLATRQQVVRTAIDDAKIDRLPSQPNGQHIATDLMAFYFATPAATDLCYEARIGGDTCRSLSGSAERPARLEGGR